MSNSDVHDVKSPGQFTELLSANLTRVSLINFYASWADVCRPMTAAVAELAKKHPELLVLQVEADSEELEGITESFDVGEVPHIFFLRGHQKLGEVKGVDEPGLKKMADKFLGKEAPAIGEYSDDQAKEKESEKELEERMRDIMRQSRVVLFMKGNPGNPQCGYSRQAVHILTQSEVEFTHFDILQDEDVRQGLKVLNNWPTFPQFIVNGEFVGGLDVIKEMADTDEFDEVFGA